MQCGESISRTFCGFSTVSMQELLPSIILSLSLSLSLPTKKKDAFQIHKYLTYGGVDFDGCFQFNQQRGRACSEMSLCSPVHEAGCHELFDFMP